MPVKTVMLHAHSVQDHKPPNVQDAMKDSYSPKPPAIQDATTAPISQTKASVSSAQQDAENAKT